MNCATVRACARRGQLAPRSMMRLRHRAQRDRRETTTGWRHHATLYLERAARPGRAGAGPRRGRRAGRRLSGQAHRIHRALHRGRHHRSGGAHRGPEGRGETGPARHRREPSGRGRQHRHGRRGQGRAGRLHHRLRRHFHQCAQSFVYPSMPFDPTKDFTGISMLGASSVVLETGPRSRSTASRIWSPMPSSIRAPRSARRERARRCIWRA